MDILNLTTFLLIGLALGYYADCVGARLASFYENGEEVGPQLSKKQGWLLFIRLNFEVKGKLRRTILSVTSGLLAILAYSVHGYSAELIVSLALLTMLIMIFTTDLLSMVIPNRVLLLFLPIFIVLRILEPLDPWWSAFAGGAIGYFIIFIIILVSRGGMGAGDMKLFGVLGIVLGWKEVLLAFFLACLFGAVIGLIMQMTGRTERKQAIPFGPYIVFGTLIAYFFGSPILEFYGGFIG
ncbi:A24 family peptidase [Aciduricibacillus chroicocephali]|uniref:A24 family peptidase n=1 Tax=Aciduricibacillus chroicocephali TaxID=3054939 RepID=A0ABY9KX10_9BACI|nr:A24 family peptidase [Bacillaceae bacterium 44XB]